MITHCFLSSDELTADCQIIIVYLSFQYDGRHFQYSARKMVTFWSEVLLDASGGAASWLSPGVSLILG